MSTKLSFSDRLIIEAKSAGYYADEVGNIYSPKGRVMIGGKTKRGHRTFTPSVYPDGRRGCALQHRFVAYFFFGDDIFNHACVRHVNDIPNDNRITNLVLGSYKDNALDIPVEKRKARSKGAGERITEQNRKLTDVQIHDMRKYRQVHNTSYKALAKMFGVTAMTAHRAVNKQSWSKV